MNHPPQADNASFVPFSVELATCAADIREAQRLRYRVFADEMGARLHSTEPGVDCDRFDPFCHHLLVRDTLTGQVVGYSRLLTDQQAQQAGGFYSQTEFAIQAILALPGRFIEVGRTCVHADYRTGATMIALWSGLADFVMQHGFDYFIGCPSIPLGEGYSEAHAIFNELAKRHLTDESLRVIPLKPLPPPEKPLPSCFALPPLLKAYLRLGAKICGEPYWDEDFQVADLFILLPTRRVAKRYARHFLGQIPRQGSELNRGRH